MGFGRCTARCRGATRPILTVGGYPKADCFLAAGRPVKNKKRYPVNVIRQGYR